jgi:hypothetical protein
VPIAELIGEIEPHLVTQSFKIAVTERLAALLWETAWHSGGLLLICAAPDA